MIRRRLPINVPVKGDPMITRRLPIKMFSLKDDPLITRSLYIKNVINSNLTHNIKNDELYGSIRHLMSNIPCINSPMCGHSYLMLAPPHSPTVDPGGNRGGQRERKKKAVLY